MILPSNLLVLVCMLLGRRSHYLLSKLPPVAPALGSSQTPHYRNMPYRKASSCSSSSGGGDIAGAERVFAIQPRIDGASLVHCPIEKYEEQLSDKLVILRALLQPHYTGEVDVFRSQPSHYRMRANFNVWRDDKRSDDPSGLFYAMWNEEKKPVEIKSFPRGCTKINELMDQLFQQLKADSSGLLAKGLFEVRFVATTSGEAVVVLIYRQPLVDEWRSAASTAAAAMGANIVGRSRKLKVVVGCKGGASTCSDGDEAVDDNSAEIIEECLSISSTDKYYLYQTEGAFSQPNAKVCEQMINWCLRHTEKSHEHDLLELYCGGGTFTMALSVNFNKVIATEVSKQSVQLASMAIKKNKIGNVQIAKMSAEEFSEAYTGTRRFQRLEDAGIDFRQANIRTVFVDPPRAGIDAKTCQLLCSFDRIVYVSCNPETLARDLAIMADTHEVVAAAAFDQFPYTHHLECGAIIKRRRTKRKAEDV